MTASGGASTEPAPAAAASGPSVLMRVMAGNPTDDELAALVTALAAVIGQALETGETGETTGEGTPPGRSASRWANPRRMLVSPRSVPGADDWRGSALPR